VVTALLLTELFQDLSPAEMTALLPAVRHHQLQRGEFFYRLGDDATHAWVLLDGHAKMVVPTPDGDETVLDVMAPGQLFGMPALFSSTRHRIGESLATEPCRALSIERSQLLRFLEHHPAAMRRALARLADLVREHAEAMTYAAHEDLRGRVARRLLDLAGMFGTRTAGGVRIGARVSQETLGGMVGATRSKVNQALASLAASGAVEVDRGVVTILDPERLRLDYPDWLNPSGRPPISRGA
jgi:CRP-like cAMP-binding protein